MKKPYRDSWTRGEREFEKFCRQNGIKLSHIQRDETKTPDYEMITGDQIIIAEVKDIERNPAERKSDEENDKEWGVGKVRDRGSDTGGKVGDRVRNKIKKASRQIAGRTSGEYPGLLVLYEYDEHGFRPSHIDSFHIRAAMYGFDNVEIAVPNDPSNSPYATGIESGGSQRMTGRQNTSISAVAVLYDGRLLVYHNDFARVPLDPKTLQGDRIRHFRYNSENVDWDPDPPESGTASSPPSVHLFTFP